MLKKVNLQFFSEGGAGDGGTGSAAGTGDAGAGEGTQNQNPQGSTGKTFSQEDLSRIVAKENKAGQKKGRDDLLKELGFDSADSLKEQLTAFQKYQESQKTEAEKTAEALKKLQDENARLTSEKNAVLAERKFLAAGVAPDKITEASSLFELVPGDDEEKRITDLLDKYGVLLKATDTGATTQKPPIKPRESSQGTAKSVDERLEERYKNMGYRR